MDRYSYNTNLFKDKDDEKNAFCWCWPLAIPVYIWYFIGQIIVGSLYRIFNLLDKWCNYT